MILLTPPKKAMKLINKINSIINFLGFYPLKLYNNLTGLFFYFNDLRKLKNQKGKDSTFVFGKKYPMLNDRSSEAGTIKGHYFFQDLFVAQKIFNSQPKKHVDIGSRIDGFVAHVASFREIEVFDIRKISSQIKEIKCHQKDFMKLDDSYIEYCDSISSLHAIEHFGLGRYGDPIDYYGHIKAISNITKMLKKNGTLHFSAPIGKQRIEFNAHRVFAIHYLLNLFKKDYKLLNFSYVDDNGDFFQNVRLDEKNIKHNFNCNWGCGIFELVKL